MGVTALVPWEQLGKRWAEMKTGQVGIDRFPASEELHIYSYFGNKNGVDGNGNKVSLRNPDGSRLKVTDGMSIPFRYIEVFAETPNWTPSWGGKPGLIRAW